MSWLVLSWFLTFGYLPQSQEAIATTTDRVEWLDNSGAFYQTIGLSATAFDHIRLYTELQTYDRMGSINQWFPYRSDYIIGLDLLAGPVTIGVRHECDHPVIWSMDQEYGYISGITEIYVKIEGKTSW